MIPVSNEYKRQLIAGNRDYQIRLGVMLADSTPPFIITNEQIWDGGITVSEAISSQNSFDIGAAIVGSLKVVINNINGEFSNYDFLNAHVTLEFGVSGDIENGQQKYYRKGTYVVDEPTYNGSLITLDCLDNMTWFDVPFKNVGFPTGSDTTAGELVNTICSYVGVYLGTPNFPNNDRTIYSASLVDITAKDINCREVIQYVAQKCCCYCKITTAGQLALKWYNKYDIINLYDYDGGTYNTQTTPYSDGDNVEGGQWYWNGSTYVWTQGDDVEGGSFQDLQNGVWISQNYEINVSTDNIIVTGIHLRSTSGKDEEKYDVIAVDTDLEHQYGRYAFVIENNPLILKAEADSLALSLKTTLAGLPIRGFNSRSLNDFSYETGDVAHVIDFRGNVYHTWLTNFTFTTNNSESFSCGVESVKQRNETRYSNTLRTLAEAEAAAEQQLTDYDRAVRAMDELAQNSIGYNEWVYPVGAGVGTTRTMWRYNGSQRTGTDSAPLFPDSSVVFKITGDGVFVSNDGGVSYTNGYDANSGTAILNLIYSIGLNCSWIHAGTLTLGGNNNKNGVLSILDASSNTIGTWNNGGISVKKGTITLGNKASLGDGNTGVYIGSTAIELGATVSGVPKFRVTDAGALTATNADIKGTIKATAGTIGSTAQEGDKWQIGAYSLYNGCTAIDSTSNGTYVGKDGIRNQNGANYVLINNGTITANNADIKGTIKTTSGEIGGWTVYAVSDTTCDAGGGALDFSNGAFLLSPYGSNRTYSGVSYTNKKCKFRIGQNFAVDNAGNVYISGNISARSGEIGYAGTGWTIDAEGLTDGEDAWVQPTKIGCGKHGATLVKMIGSTSGNSGYLSVEVNDNNDYVRVKTNLIERKRSGGTDYATFSSGSDERIKKEIEPLSIDEARAIIEDTETLTFRYKEGDQVRHYGFVAQRIEKECEDLGIENPFVKYGEMEGDLKMVDYTEFIAPLMRVVQNQQEEIDLLKQELAELKARVK